MTFEVTILGSSSATPIYNRHPTAQVLNIRERFFLIDCGEGTQTQLVRHRFRLNRLTHIFISHLHGDHYFGLMGLLSTMHLNGRTDELHLFGQEELMDVIEMQLRLSNTQLKYNLIFHPVKHYLSSVIFDDDDVTVKTIIMNHRIPCVGYLFKQKPKARKILINKIQQHNIPISFFNKLKNGDDYIDENGNTIPNSELTVAPPEPRTYAFCSDTIYDESIIDEINEADLLYYEATFSHDMLERATATYHCTSIQAGQMALKAGVRKLIIGHFSARYKILTPLLEEARSVFPDTFLAIEGSRFKV